MPNYNNPYYNPYNQNPYVQPTYAQQNPQYQQPVQLNQYTYVNGIEGAKSFQVQPGKTVLLVDNDNPFVYFKTANDFGQSSLRYFSIMEIDETKVKSIIGGAQNQIDSSNFVNRSDFDALVSKYETLNKKLNKLLKEGDSNA